MLQNPHVLLTFDKVHNPLLLPREATSEPPKVVREGCVLYILTSKCASRHNGVHFFDISTAKSGPHLVCFVHFDLDMCFAPQRRALFRHLNCQKWSGPCVFCTFWLQNVLRATTACTFSTSQLPKVLRAPGALYILTWKCASRHNGVQFFISPLASWLRTRRFSEPTFRPSRATNHRKNTVFRDFPTFSRISIVFPLPLSLLPFSLLIFLFSLPLPYSAFHLSILSEVWLLNFLRPHAPRSSKTSVCIASTWEEWFFPCSSIITMSMGWKIKPMTRFSSGRGDLRSHFCWFFNIFVLVVFPESACEGFFVKKQPSYYIFTPWQLLIYTSADLHLHTLTSADLHLHTLTSADLHLHTLTPADLDLHTFTSADLHLHTFTSADLHLHTLTPADLHLHTLTSADLHLHTLTPADLDLHTFTSADLHLHTPHTCRSTSSHPHTLTLADLHLNTLTPADLDLHTFTSADLHLHTFTSADLLSLFFLFSLKAGAVPPERHETQPFRTKWTLDVKNWGKIAI